jgi:hypothetical protein
MQTLVPRRGSGSGGTGKLATRCDSWGGYRQEQSETVLRGFGYWPVFWTARCRILCDCRCGAVLQESRVEYTWSQNQDPRQCRVLPPPFGIRILESVVDCTDKWA